MKKIAIILAFFALIIQAAGAVRSIVKVFPQDKEGWRQVLRTEALDDLGRGQDHLMIITTPEQMKRLEQAGCRLEMLVPDISKISRPKGGLHSFAEMRTILQNLAASHSAIARLDSIGNTWEGRPILCLKISDNVNSTEEEPRLLYMGLHHAREWISLEVPLRFAMMLADSYGVNPAWTELVDGREFFIVPCVNPDGFVYDYNTNNYWRKNRRNNGGSYGVDLNRNYDGAQNGDPEGNWGGAGSSHTPSSETYCGPSAFSEPEAQAIRDLFLIYPFDMSMSYHTYSELVMWPWGYTAAPAPDAEILSALGTEMAALISSETGSGTYTAQQCMSLYPTTGTSEEWLYGYSRYHTSRTDLAYITEMAYYDFHDTATSQVNSICAQNLEAAFYMAQAAGAPYSYVAPGAPALAASDTMPAGGNFTLSWTPANAGAGIDVYELRVLSGLTRTTDNAESGIGRWDTTRFKVSTNRYHSATHSFRADSAHGLNASLASVNPFTAQTGDSLVYWRWVSTESGWDYFYVEVSADGGASWNILEELDGAYATWTRRAYSMTPYAGQQVLVRFRYTTDGNTLAGGVYLDDIGPCEVFSTDSLVSDTITGQSYVIAGLPMGTYYYRVRAHNVRGWGGWSNLVKVSPVTGTAGWPAAPLEGQASKLMGAVPNPTHRSARIAFHLADGGVVKLRLYNSAGQLVRTLVESYMAAGGHAVSWDGRDDAGRKVSTGVYYYRMSAKGYNGAGRLTVVR
jgi:hypothetical protein